MVRGSRWIAIAVVATGCVGDVEVPSQLEALSMEAAAEHHAPDAEGNCPVSPSPSEAWTAEIATEDQHLPFTEGVVDMGVDRCGSVVVAWRGYQSHSKHLSVARLLPDGQLDWHRQFTYRTGYQQLLDLAVDEFGNSLILTGGSLRVLTAAGEAHPHVPEQGFQFGPARRRWARRARKGLVSHPAPLWTHRSLVRQELAPG